MRIPGGTLRVSTTLAILAALVFFLALFLAPPRAMALIEDDVVPEGAWGARLRLHLETQDATLDKASRFAPLINYVIPDDEIRAQVEGNIERSIQRLDFLFTYGVTDRWNLSLNIPYLELEQDSTLEPTSTDPDVVALVERLQSKKLSGTGDYTLTSLHRTIFSDWNAFLVGYGFIVPSTSQQGVYVGAPTFDTVSAVTSTFVLFHYTRYPAIHGARFDLRAWGSTGFKGRASVPDGPEKKLEPGNRISLLFAWSQEFGPVSSGLEYEFFDQRSGSLNGTRLKDQARGQYLRFQLGFGNLAGLEKGPLAFPFRFDMQIESLERGSNLPKGERILFTLQTYF